MSLKFKNAKCFGDLVQCNISYIRGEIRICPSYSDALHSESKYIKNDLLEICGRGVLTISSQPANVSKYTRQRGYVSGAFLGDVDKFLDAMESCEGLEFIVCDTEIYVESIAPSHLGKDAYRVWDFTQVKEDGEWVTEFGECLTDKGTSIMDEYYFYNTSHYDVMCDKDVVYFMVCDAEYGMATNNSCVELLKALKRM